VLVTRGRSVGLDARLQDLLERGELRGDRGEAVVVHGEPRLVAAGVGPADELDADALRTAAAVTAQALARVGGSLAWQLDPSLPLSLPEQAAALVEGTVLGGYSPGAWKTQEQDRRPRGTSTPSVSAFSLISIGTGPTAGRCYLQLPPESPFNDEGAPRWPSPCRSSSRLSRRAPTPPRPPG
jgi:hypothetical protein